MHIISVVHFCLGILGMLGTRITTFSENAFSPFSLRERLLLEMVLKDCIFPSLDLDFSFSLDSLLLIYCGKGSSFNF